MNNVRVSDGDAELKRTEYLRIEIMSECGGTGVFLLLVQD